MGLVVVAVRTGGARAGRTRRGRGRCRRLRRLRIGGLGCRGPLSVRRLFGGSGCLRLTCRSGCGRLLAGYALLLGSLCRSSCGRLLLGDEHRDLAGVLIERGLQLRLRGQDCRPGLLDVANLGLGGAGLLGVVGLSLALLDRREVELVDGIVLVGGESVDVLGSQQGVVRVGDRVGTGQERAAVAVDVGLDGVLLEHRLGPARGRLGGGELSRRFRDLGLKSLYLEHRRVIALGKRVLLLPEHLNPGAQGGGLSPQVRDLVG